jgi:hypothetical protein
MAEAAMQNHRIGWIFGAVWILLAVALLAAYAAGTMGVATSVFAAFCLIALAAIGYKFGTEMSRPPETIEQVLYDLEHSTPEGHKHAA